MKQSPPHHQDCFTALAMTGGRGGDCFVLEKPVTSRLVFQAKPNELEHDYMSKLSLDSTVVRGSEQLSTDLGDETVILGLASEEYYSLKDVGARIWDMLREPKTVKEIRDVILSEYAVEPERCQRELLAFLQQLADEGIVEVRNEDAQVSEAQS